MVSVTVMQTVISKQHIFINDCKIAGAFDSKELKQVDHTQSSLIDENAFRLLSKSAYKVVLSTLVLTLIWLSFNYSALMSNKVFINQTIT